MRFIITSQRTVMDRENYYRRKAAELRRQCGTELNVSTRAELELLATGYDRLADHARRNAKNNVIYEYSFQSRDKTRQQRRQAAQAQQQQQRQNGNQ
jgi:hypothetical protein